MGKKILSSAILLRGTLLFVSECWSMSEKTMRKTGGSGNVVLHMYTENSMHGTSNQRVCLKEYCSRRNTYAQKWKETPGNPWIDNK